MSSVDFEEVMNGFNQLVQQEAILNRQVNDLENYLKTIMDPLIT
ncbi:hypothetical protein [Lysinibacillus sp. FSL P2-0066]